MNITGINPETGEVFEAEASDVTSEFIKKMSEFEMSEAGIKKLIDNLDISADAKAILHRISSVTIRAGEFVLRIGKKILDYVCSILNAFPTATFAMVFGAIIGYLIASIPILGVVLGPVVTPILMALGLVFGAKDDINNSSLARKIAEANAQFSELKT